MVLQQFAYYLQFSCWIFPRLNRIVTLILRLETLWKSITSFNLLTFGVSWCKEQAGNAYNFCRMKWSQGLTKDVVWFLFLIRSGFSTLPLLLKILSCREAIIWRPSLILDIKEHRYVWKLMHLICYAMPSLT